VQEVNRLLEQFKQMQKLMKQMRGMGMMGMMPGHGNARHARTLFDRDRRTAVNETWP
jgi:signal recognition particle GTPase